ncbi:MAG: hypothetical protein L3K18_09610 [Thermoplasmata archaeon]|nr:hypothetical protein [Thermoplasmata archaeon]
MCDYYDRTRHITSMPQPLTHPGRVDMARSVLIQRLRENEQFLYSHSWDTDVTPHTIRIEGMPPPMPLDKLQRYIEEDRELGFDVVVGTTMGPNSQPQVWASPEQWAVASSDNPFEIANAAAGFFSMTRQCALGLKALGSLTMGDGKEMTYYCFNDKTSGEDISLFKNVQDSGFRVCCDPRIIVSHDKVQKQVMDPGWYGNQKNAAIQILRNRRKKALEDEEAGLPGPLD